MKKAILKKKRYSSLIIEIVSSTYVNIIIRLKLIIEEELKECERYRIKRKLTQYFKCYYYRYIEKIYNRLKVCDFCAKLYIINFYLN